MIVMPSKAKPPFKTVSIKYRRYNGSVPQLPEATTEDGFIPHYPYPNETIKRRSGITYVSIRGKFMAPATYICQAIFSCALSHKLFQWVQSCSM